MTFKELYSRLPLWKQISLSQCYQNPIHHPEIWIDKHLEIVFNNVDNFFGDNIDLKICAIFHDIGKDDCWQKSIVKTSEAKWSISPSEYILKLSNIGHENRTKHYIDEWKHLYDDLDINWDMVYEVCKEHMRAHMYTDNRMSNRNKRIQFESLDYFNEIIQFSKCDSFNPLKTNNYESKEIV